MSSNWTGLEIMRRTYGEQIQTPRCMKETRIRVINQKMTLIRVNRWIARPLEKRSMWLSLWGLLNITLFCLSNNNYLSGNFLLPDGSFGSLAALPNSAICIILSLTVVRQRPSHTCAVYTRHSSKKGVLVGLKISLSAPVRRCSRDQLWPTATPLARLD